MIGIDITHETDLRELFKEGQKFFQLMPHLLEHANTEEQMRSMMWEWEVVDVKKSQVIAHRLPDFSKKAFAKAHIMKREDMFYNEQAIMLGRDQEILRKIKFHEDRIEELKLKLFDYKASLEADGFVSQLKML